MRKTKLLLVAFMAMLGLSTNAQSWTPASVEEGEFYLYNVGKDMFFGKGNGWGTQASMTPLADGNTIKVTLVPVGDYYFINTKVGNDAWGLENLADAGAVYTDQSRGKQSTWEFKKIGDENVYNIISKENHAGGAGAYLTANANNTILAEGTDGNTDYAKWKLLSPSEKDAAILEIALKSYKDRYNNIKAAVLAINSGIDLSTADATAAAATDEAGYNTAVLEVRNALTNYLTSASLDATIDLTDALIDNAAPGISGNMNYWTNSGNPSLQHQLYEYYNAKGATSKQTIAAELPIGYYILRAIAYTREGMDGTIFAGDKAQTLVGVAPSVVNDRNGGNNWIANGNGVNSFVFNLEAATSNLEIGIKASSDNSALEKNDGWTCWRSFQLIFAKDLAAIYKQPLKDAVDKANLFEEGTIPAAAYSALQATITKNNKAWSTASEYEAAIKEINDAAAAAASVQISYLAYIETADAAKNMKDADTYTGAEAKSTLEGVLSSTKTNVEAATTVDAISAETAKLVAAAKTFVKAVKIDTEKGLDITCLIVNPHFKFGEGGKKTPTGWTLESGAVTEHRLSTHNFEAWHSKFNLSQTITELPKGTYKVSLQGFARHDNASVTDKTTLYCGIKTVAIKDIQDEYSTTSYYNAEKPAMGDTNRDAEATVEGQKIYRPNGMTGAYYWFQETNAKTGLPFYTSEVETLITEDGDLKIGFKCEADADWVLWDNFHLYYYGSAIAVTLDEAEGAAFSKDIEDANVTLKKTIAEGWNTVILPIAATKAEIGASELYTYAGDDAQGVLQFTSANSIEPNVPYLMKATAASDAAIKFNGVTVKAAAESLAATGDAFDFVGTYTGTTASANDYVLTATAFAKAKGGNTIKAYRAFIQKKAETGGEEARELKFEIDGVVTAIDAIDGKAVNNNATIYNLAGQQVKNAKKGLYIQNGKKFVVK